MKHRKSDKFRDPYSALPPAVQAVADKNFELLKTNPRHPWLQFKRVGPHWTLRAGLDYRAVALGPDPGILVWFWIRPHDEHVTADDCGIRARWSSEWSALVQWREPVY